MMPLTHGLSDCFAMIDRCLRGTIRQVEALLMSIVMPVFLMLLFVYVFGGALNTGMTYVNYVVPGVIVLCAGFRSASTAVTMAMDLERGVIDRFRSMPIASSSVLVGHATASVLVNVLSTAIVLAVAFAAGFRPSAGPLEWILAGGLLVLFILAISWVAIGVGLLFGNVEAANGATFFMLFLPYLSSGFVPTGSMPRPLELISQYQPYTPLIDALRGLLLDTQIGNSGWLALAWFGTILVLAMLWSFRLFRRQTA